MQGMLLVCMVNNCMANNSAVLRATSVAIFLLLSISVRQVGPFKATNLLVAGD